MGIESGIISYQWMAHIGEFPHRLVCHYNIMGSSGCENTEKYDTTTGINEAYTTPIRILNYIASLNSSSSSTTTSTAALLLLLQWLLTIFVLITLFTFYIT